MSEFFAKGHAREEVGGIRARVRWVGVVTPCLRWCGIRMFERYKYRWGVVYYSIEKSQRSFYIITVGRYRCASHLGPAIWCIMRSCRSVSLRTTALVTIADEEQLRGIESRNQVAGSRVVQFAVPS